MLFIIKSTDKEVVRLRFDIAYSCVSHIGKVRSMNQDNFICNGIYADPDRPETVFPLYGSVSTKTPALFGIFDGMGGEECGEIASYIAAKEATAPAAKDGVRFLADYCKRANAAICDYADSNTVSAMGTTAAMLLFSKEAITLCNIGDSKIFRFSGGKAEQISRDHVAVSAFGRKPPLSQNLGIPPNLLLIEPYLSQGVCTYGDKYLICSDGLTDMVTTDDIAGILADHPTEEAASALVNRALQNGGKDNVTVITLEIRQIKHHILSFFQQFKRRGNV